MQIKKKMPSTVINETEMRDPSEEETHKPERDRERE